VGKPTVLRVRAPKHLSMGLLCGAGRGLAARNPPPLRLCTSGAMMFQYIHEFIHKYIHKCIHKYNHMPCKQGQAERLYHKLLELLPRRTCPSWPNMEEVSLPSVSSGGLGIGMTKPLLARWNGSTTCSRFRVDVDAVGSAGLKSRAKGVSKKRL